MTIAEHHLRHRWQRSRFTRCRKSISSLIHYKDANHSLHSLQMEAQLRLDQPIYGILVMVRWPTYRTLHIGILTAERTMSRFTYLLLTDVQGTSMFRMQSRFIHCRLRCSMLTLKKPAS